MPASKPIKILQPDQVEGAREYVRLERKGMRASFAEQVKKAQILFSVGLSHFDLLRAGGFSGSIR